LLGVTGITRPGNAGAASTGWETPLWIAEMLQAPKFLSRWGSGTAALGVGGVYLVLRLQFYTVLGN
jgi:hypothetical protein